MDHNLSLPASPPANSQAARGALGAALLLGVAAQQLLFYGPIGAGMVLWMALFGVGALLVVRQAGFAWQRETALAAGLATAAAAIMALRASPALHALAFLVIVIAASIPLLRARSLRFGATSVAAQILGIAAVVAHALGGVVPLVVREAAINDRQVRTRRSQIGVVARGLLLAVPPLVVFGALFVSADPLFERYARDLSRIVTEDVLGRVGLMLIFTWIAAGLLRSLLPRRSPLAALPSVPALRSSEVHVALGAITVLFTLFVLVQARWLFDSAGRLEATTGLTVADYARRGFFEMVSAAALALPLLIAANAIARPVTATGRRTLRLLSVTLVVLVLLVLASAMQRMLLYTSRFGLTEQRLYTTAFMVWLGIVFAWLLVTTLRGRRRRFSAGPIAAGVAAVFALAVLNPDALIARVNLERATAGTTLDANYLNHLSADAVPVLLQRLDTIAPGSRCEVVRALLKYEGKRADHWLGANLALEQAATMVASRAASIDQAVPHDCRTRREH